MGTESALCFNTAEDWHVPQGVAATPKRDTVGLPTAKTKPHLLDYAPATVALDSEVSLMA